MNPPGRTKFEYRTAQPGGLLMSTILIVEGNEKNMKPVRDILRRTGHHA